MRRIILLCFVLSLLGASNAFAGPRVVLEGPSIVADTVRRNFQFKIDMPCYPDDRLEVRELRKELVVAMENAGFDIVNRGKYLLKLTIDQYSCGLSGVEDEFAWPPFGIIGTTDDESSAHMRVSSELLDASTFETILLREFDASAPLSNDRFRIWFFHSNETRIRTSLKSLWLGISHKLIDSLRKDIQ